MLEGYLEKHWELLMLMTIGLGYVVFEYVERSRKNSNSRILRFIKERQHGLMLAMIFPISVISIVSHSKLEVIQDSIKEIEEFNRRMNEKLDIVNELKKVRNEFDPILDSLFNVEIDETLAFFDNAIHEKRYVFYDKKKFSAAYGRTFKLFPKTHILATSLPDSNYFWSADGEELKPLEYAIKEFIRNKGSMTRIFYLDEESINNPRTNRVLKRQADLGVKVFTVRNITRKCFFVIYEGQDFGWVAETESNKSISKWTFTRNQDDLRLYNNKFKELLDDETLKEYKLVKQ